MSQYPAGPTPFGQNQQMMHSSEEGAKAAQLSLIFGIVGLFALGLVFGPLALIQARKAERHNTPATAGKVLGWISTIWGLLVIVLLVLFFGTVAAFMPASGY
jgi:uncharacterized Tic20 family protein